jgi:hypothetical protein
MTNASRIPHGHEGPEGYPVSKDNYLISVDDSLNRLAFYPEQHMPLPVDDLSYGPLAHKQIGLSREVVLHALSFQTLDLYIDHSIRLAEALSEPYPVPRSVLYWACTPLQIHIKAFGRHVGLAISQEHKRLDELLEGLKQAFLRGDGVMQGIDSENAFWPAYTRLRDSVLDADCVVSLVTPSGEARSLGFLSKLMGKHLQELIIGAFQKEQVSVIQAVVLGQPDDAVFAESLSECAPLEAANRHMETMGITQARDYRKDMGFSPLPERQEIHKRFESLLRSEHPFEQGQALALYEYAHPNPEALHSAMNDCFLQWGGLVKPAVKPDAHSAAAAAFLNNPILKSLFTRALKNPIIQSQWAFAETKAGKPNFADVTGNIMAVFAELKGTACPVQQLATACLWASEADTYAAIMASPTDELLDRIATYTSADECSRSPNLLAVLRSQPIQKIRAWADAHDHEDKVVSLLYQMTEDTQYLQMVKSLVVRGELFGQDLGL